MSIKLDQLNWLFILYYLRHPPLSSELLNSLLGSFINNIDSTIIMIKMSSHII